MSSWFRISIIVMPIPILSKIVWSSMATRKQASCGHILDLGSINMAAFSTVFAMICHFCWCFTAWNDIFSQNCHWKTDWGVKMCSFWDKQTLPECWDCWKLCIDSEPFKSLLGLDSGTRVSSFPALVDIALGSISDVVAKLTQTDGNTHFILLFSIVDCALLHLSLPQRNILAFSLWRNWEIFTMQST